jgi:hypothetical protein
MASKSKAQQRNQCKDVVSPVTLTQKICAPLRGLELYIGGWFGWHGFYPFKICWGERYKINMFTVRTIYQTNYLENY